MKKLFFALAIMATVLMACSSGPTLVGTWKLDSVAGEELTESEKEGTMTFNEDGTCESKRGEMSKKGTWSLSDDKKSLTVNTDGREETMDGVEISDDTFSFNDHDIKITFKRAQ